MKRRDMGITNEAKKTKGHRKEKITKKRLKEGKNRRKPTGHRFEKEETYKNIMKKKVSRNRNGRKSKKMFRENEK